MTDYQSQLNEHLRKYKDRELPGLADGIWHQRGQPRTYAHILPKEQHQLNILPSIREKFWAWQKDQQPGIKLHQYFHHLNSSQALSFNLFFPFIHEDGRTIDSRLVKALNLVDNGTYTGHFERIFDKAENTSFDFYIEGHSGQKIFFELKLSERAFGSCRNDEKHCVKLEDHYRPHLAGHVDARWLERKTFFKNYQILRNISYLGRHPHSGLVFIFPKANESLSASDEAIKKIVSRSLAPRVEILYLEYLLARILTLTEDDAALHAHFMDFKDKYLVPPKP